MKHIQQIKQTTLRRGSVLAEGIVACIILGVAISMLVPALAAIGRQRQAMRFDTLAMIELNNIANVIRKQDMQPSEVKISDWFSHRYSDAGLTVDPLPDPGDATKEILDGLRLTIRRPQAESMPDQKVSVVVWLVKRGPTP